MDKDSPREALPPGKGESMKKIVLALLLGTVLTSSANTPFDELVEGSGCGPLQLGLSECEVVETAGTPQRSWIVWEDKHMDCLVVKGKLVEVRINQGSEATFKNGIGMESTPAEIRDAYGEPEVKTPQPGVETWGYPDKGILFWILKDGKINQIVLFNPRKD